MTLASKAARSAFWVATGSGTLAVVSLLTVIVLARLLGPSEFGLAALALMIVQVVTLFVEAPFNDAIIQRADLERSHIDTAFWASVGIALILIAGCFAADDVVSDVFDEPRLPSLIKWLAISVAFSALNSIPVAQLRREMRFRELTLRSVVSRIAGMVVAISMAYAGHGVWSIVAQQVVTASMATALLWTTGLCLPRLHFSRSHLQELAAIGVPVFATKLVSFSAGRIFSILIGYFLGLTALGYWNAAMRVVDTLAGLLWEVAGGVGLTVFARQQSELEVMRRGFYTASQMVTLVSVPIFAGLIVIAGDFVELVLGAQWLPAVPIIQIAAFAAMMYFTFFMFGDVLFTALGRPGWALVLSACNLALTIIGLLLFHKLGLTAAAIVWTGTWFLTLPLMLVMIRELIAIDFAALLRSLAQPFIASGVMALILVCLKLELLWNWPDALRLAILIPCGALLYTFLIRILAPSLFQQFVGLAKSAIIPATRPGKID